MPRKNCPKYVWNWAILSKISLDLANFVQNLFGFEQFRGTDKFQHPTEVHLINHLKPIRCNNLKIEHVNAYKN